MPIEPKQLERFANASEPFLADGDSFFVHRYDFDLTLHPATGTFDESKTNELYYTLKYKMSEGECVRIFRQEGATRAEEANPKTIAKSTDATKRQSAKTTGTTANSTDRISSPLNDSPSFPLDLPDSSQDDSTGEALFASLKREEPHFSLDRMGFSDEPYELPKDAPSPSTSQQDEAIASFSATSTPNGSPLIAVTRALQPKRHAKGAKNPEPYSHADPTFDKLSQALQQPITARLKATEDDEDADKQLSPKVLSSFKYLESPKEFPPELMEKFLELEQELQDFNKILPFVASVGITIILMACLAQGILDFALYPLLGVSLAQAIKNPWFYGIAGFVIGSRLFKYMGYSLDRRKADWRAQQRHVWFERLRSGELDPKEISQTITDSDKLPTLKDEMAHIFPTPLECKYLELYGELLQGHKRLEENTSPALPRYIVASGLCVLVSHFVASDIGQGWLPYVSYTTLFTLSFIAILLYQWSTITQPRGKKLAEELRSTFDLLTRKLDLSDAGLAELLRQDSRFSKAQFFQVLEPQVEGTVDDD